ncbi:MAG: V-type ATP synthase subunit E [Eubacteriales bacterium]|nr:V-type ATP synthase subunit E [Eubacteriales bacterium]
MGSSDMILDSIRSDCDKTVEAIASDSAKICEEILAKGKEDAANAKADIDLKAQQKASQIKAANKSRGELEQRNALLRIRRLEINKTYEKVYEYLLDLDGEKYFDIIYKLLKKLTDSQGVLYLNQKDLQRLPADFSQKLKSLGTKATLSEKPVDIDGGFILKNGDIEENMSFSALLSSNRDSLEDLINRELFTR